MKFKNWLELNGLSEGTSKIYRYYVNMYFSEYDDFTQENIEDFLLSKKRKYAKETFNKIISSLSKYAHYKNVDINFPSRATPKRKIPNVVTKEYFEDEIIPTAECIFQEPLRAKAVLRFMFETGCRKGEVENLKRENFNFEDNTVKIDVPKQNKELIKYYTDKTKYDVKSYFSISQEEDNAFNLGIQTIRYIFDQLKEYLNNSDLHPHLFRHSYATLLRKNGASLEDIQELMGLESYQTVLRYAHIGQEDIKKKYNKYYK